MSLNLLRKLRSLGRARGGNVGPVFALAAIPAFTLVGGAVDYARAHSYQTFLQSLLDAATTASAREYANTANTVAAENRLRDVVLAGLAQHSGGRVTFQCWIDQSSHQKDYEYLVTLTSAASGTQTPVSTCANTPPANIPPDAVVLKNGSFSTSNASINPTLTSAVATTALSLAHVNFITVMAASQASLSGKKLEVAMMLDTTGSMNESAGTMSKLAAMQSAANDMFNILTPSLNAGNTRIAIVPFAEGVNAGSYGSAIWGPSPAATSGYSVTTGSGRYARTYTYTYYKTACVTERYTASAFTDNPPASGDYYWPLYNSSGSCAEQSAILPMTSTLATLQAKVNGLRSSGSTPGHLGTQWAWNMLSPKWAGVWGTAAAPVAYDDKGVMKVAILMTDGEYNLQFCKGVDDGNMNCSDPNGDSPTQARTFCENMKAQGITVYTIGFQIDVQSARDTLISCASYSKSDPTKKLYYFPYSSADIKAAFADIGNQLKAGQSGVILGN